MKFQQIQSFSFFAIINRTSHIRSKGEVERDVLQKQVRVRRRDGYVAAEKRQRNMSVELCCVEKHDVIGKICKFCNSMLGKTFVEHGILHVNLTCACVLNSFNLQVMLKWP